MIEIMAGGFRLMVELDKETMTASICGFSGQDTRLCIPATVVAGQAEYPVTSIARKAFLNCRGLREAYVPESVTAIGDWAFSQCIHLKKAVIGGLPVFERGAFEGSERLEQIFLSNASDEGLAKLLGATVFRLPAEYLLKDSEIGKKSWYEKWDLALSSFLARDDHEGLVDHALCGEEDISYDSIGTVDGEMPGQNIQYLREVEKNKCFLCMLRLSYDSFLQESDRKRYEVYITERTIGTPSESSWLLLKEDYSDDPEIFEKYLDIVEPSSEMVDMMLANMGDSMAQVKALLIKRNASDNKTGSFFDDLSL